MSIGSGNQDASAERAQATPQERSVKDNSPFRLPASSAVEQAKERLLLAMAALGATRRQSELGAHVDALLASVVQPYEAEIAWIVAMLKSELDRDWEAETPKEVAVIAANALHWRLERAERAEAALKGNDHCAALLPGQPLASPPITETLPIREHTEHYEDHNETTFSLGRFVVVRREWGKGEYSWAVTDDHGNGFPTPFNELRELITLLGSVTESEKEHADATRRSAAQASHSQPDAEAAFAALNKPEPDAIP